MTTKTMLYILLIPLHHREREPALRKPRRTDVNTPRVIEVGPATLQLITRQLKQILPLPYRHYFPRPQGKQGWFSVLLRSSSNNELSISRIMTPINPLKEQKQEALRSLFGGSLWQLNEYRHVVNHKKW